MVPRVLSMLSMAACITLLSHSTVLSAPLTGTIDQASGAGWQSAYLDLEPPRDFKKGDRLVIKVEGSAEWVRVRLLPQNGNPSQPTGLVGGKTKVPAGGKLEFTLNEDRPKVKQISVHAGEKAWSETLNARGGEARIISVDVNP